MIANQMKALFILLYEGAGLGERTFEDREVSDFLTIAQEEFVLSRFTRDANVKQKGFEDDNKRDLDLSGLVTGTAVITADFMIQGNEDNGALRTPDIDNQWSATSSSVAGEYGVYVPIPDEAMFIIQEQCDIYKGSYSSRTDIRKNVKVKQVDWIYYNNLIRDAYRNPSRDLVWRLSSGNLKVSEVSGSGTVSFSSSEKYIEGSKYSEVLQGDLTPATLTFNQDNRAALLIPGKGYYIDKYYVSYVKKPVAILVDTINPANQVNSELNSSVHREIVELAVDIATRAKINPEQKYQLTAQKVINNQ